MSASSPKIPLSIQCIAPAETNREGKPRDIICRFRTLSSYKNVALEFSNSPTRRANLHWAVQIGPYMYEVRKRPEDKAFMFNCLREGEAGFWTSKYTDEVLFPTRMTDEDIFLAVLDIALKMYNDGGYKLSERNCQDFVVSLVNICCENTSMRGRRWCYNGCRDPVACLKVQSRHHYDKNHSRLKDLARAALSFGRMMSVLDVTRYLQCNDPKSNLYKARQDFRTW